jgi:hypothetical protein
MSISSVSNLLSSFILNKKPLGSIMENQGVISVLVVPTGIEPVSPA